MLSNNTRRVYLLDAPLCRIWFRLSYDYFLSFFFMTRHSKRSLSLSPLQIEPFSLSLSSARNTISDDRSTDRLFLDRCISCRSST